MTDKRYEVLILGGGLSGLSAAFHLQRRGFDDYLILERDDKVGGLARTAVHDGFSFDRSIHILYTSDPYAASLITEELLPDNLRRQERRSFCFSQGVYTEYPYQLNNYGLPTSTIVENVLGLVEAQRSGLRPEDSPNFEEWVKRTFGTGIARNFMLPYNRRVWAWDLADMSYDWIADRVPTPKLEDVMRGALNPSGERIGPNQEFWYPKEGGIQSLPQALARYIPSERVSLDTNVVSIDPFGRRVTLEDGSTLEYETLIATAPLPVLVGLLGPSAPEETRARAARLKHNAVHTVNVGLVGSHVGAEPMHWVYYPSEETIFHRASFPHEFSPAMVPRGCSSIQVEISESAQRRVDRSSLVARTLEGLVTVGLLRTEEARPVSEGGRVVVANVVTLEPAYVIYDLEHASNTELLRNFFEERGIVPVGRFGQWEYFNMDRCLLEGRAAIDRCLGIVSVVSTL